MSHLNWKSQAEKVSLNVIAQFRAWLQLLEKRQWFLLFRLNQVEEIIL